MRESAEAILGRDSFFIDPNDQGGMLVKDRMLIALCSRAPKPGTVVVSFRASTPPNTVALLISQMVLRGLKIELDPYFEFNHNGDMLVGAEACRFFAENAMLLLFGEKPASVGANSVRPKGQYVKHRFN